MLTALEKLDLQDQLDDLMISAKTANGLDLLDINDQIDEVMTKLGFGVGKPAGASSTKPEPEPEPKPPAPEDNGTDATPQIVVNFLTGKYHDAKVPELVNALNEVRDYVGPFISIEQLAQQCSEWQSHNGYAIG